MSLGTVSLTHLALLDKGSSPRSWKSINVCMFRRAYPKETDAHVSMHVQAYVMVRIISHLAHVCVCLCVSVCTQALEVPLVMLSEICPAAVPLNSCSLLKGSLSSSAPIPLCSPVSLFSLRILFAVIRRFMLMRWDVSPTNSHPWLSDTTALSHAPWRFILMHKVAFRVSTRRAKPSCRKTFNMKRHFKLWKLCVCPATQSQPRPS